MAAERRQVLVVEDEPHLCGGLRRLLELEGYPVFTAGDGETALELAGDRSPDVILLDLVLPGIDGREVGRKVRELSPRTQKS